MNIPKNMGTADKVLRTSIALLFFTLFFNHVISGTTGIILVVLSTIFLLTSLAGSCPLYIPFNIHTNRKQN